MKAVQSSQKVDRMVAHHQVGIVFGSLTPPEELPQGAALAEELGFGEVWFSEDCFFTGGMSGLTQLLSSTTRITAGLGLASVVSRHPAVLAMELAGIARLYPGRARAAVGLGNRHWLGQMGLLPDRPLTAVTETLEVLRDLLAGRTVAAPTHVHHFDDVTLSFPPTRPPELWVGAVNARALKRAGAQADGVLLSVLSSPRYVRWAKGLIAAGAEEAGRPVPRITAYALAAVDDDEGRALDAVRNAVGFFVDAEAETALVTQSSLASDVAVRRAAGGDLPTPDSWVRELAVVGDPSAVAARIDGLLDAGADSVGLWLFPPERAGETMRRLSDHLYAHARAT